jgi:hypothetical protein
MNALTRFVLCWIFALWLIPAGVCQASFPVQEINTNKVRLKNTVSFPEETAAFQVYLSYRTDHHRCGDRHSPLLVTRSAFLLSGGWKKFHQTTSLNNRQTTLQPFPLAVPHASAFTISPLQERLCKTTCRDSVLIASALVLPGKSRRHREKALINYFLGNFLTGQGPENTLFPASSEVSSWLCNAGILKTTLRQYLDNPCFYDDSLFHRTVKFQPVHLCNTLLQPLSLRHFVGSAEIVITMTADSLFEITILNTTSITSADFSTHLKKTSRWPASKQRCTSPGPLSNTCQVFHLLLTKDELFTLANRKLH